MALTTLDGVIDGFDANSNAGASRMFFKALSGTLVAGRPHSYWGFAGIPGAGAFDTTLNGVTLTSPVNGQIPYTDAASGNKHLARFVGSATQISTLVIADRIWHNGGYTITSTSAQNSTTPTWTARDVAGSTNGDGIICGMEISATTGAGTPTITMAYTNQAGTASRSATNVIATVASSIAGTFYPIGLQAGDTGVRSVQSITLSATWTSGTMNLVAYRPLASISVATAQAGEAVDILTSGMPKLYNGTVPYIFIIPSATTTSTIRGMVTYTEG